ncbi:hypothetical protein AVEN_60594-1 [Araneus ventricosus]|uniref:Integrase catalytic domain-containing protein n=1 Tax=Araneus ventricosus TaxID=182803 RepID=A0A4Y2F2D3_ARAVE|nr:hypothetical protein AVEN_60594-1 [Araneus ventricosus]
MFSDRGTNFVSADLELKRFMAAILSSEEFQNKLAQERIVWKFNSPSAPHFGDLWENGIKQMKTHLKRTIGAQLLTSEEFLTLVTQVEF